MKKILRFTASWCGPCKALAANLEIANVGIPIEVVDIDVYEDIAGEYRIRSVPTLVMLEDEKEVKRLTGAKTVNQIQEWVA
jgi:thioredoxin-like negative regulator of GroEL